MKIFFCKETWINRHLRSNGKLLQKLLLLDQVANSVPQSNQIRCKRSKYKLTSKNGHFLVLVHARVFVRVVYWMNPFFMMVKEQLTKNFSDKKCSCLATDFTLVTSDCWLFEVGENRKQKKERNRQENTDYALQSQHCRL